MTFIHSFCKHSFITFTFAPNNKKKTKQFSKELIPENRKKFLLFFRMIISIRKLRIFFSPYSQLKNWKKIHKIHKIFFFQQLNPIPFKQELRIFQGHHESYVTMSIQDSLHCSIHLLKEFCLHFGKKENLKKKIEKNVK